MWFDDAHVVYSLIMMLRCLGPSTSRGSRTNAGAVLIAMSITCSCCHAGSFVVVQNEAGNGIFLGGISDDGRSASGTINYRGTSPPIGNPIRWTADGGVTAYSLPAPRITAGASGISGDGRVLVAAAADPSLVPYRNQGLVIDAGESQTEVPLLAGLNNNQPLRANRTGSVVVGYQNALNRADSQRAYRWSVSTGTVSLGMLPGDNNSRAWRISSAGDVIVGDSGNSTTGRVRGFIWTSSGGMRPLETPPGNLYGYYASALSRSGEYQGGLEVSTGAAVLWQNGVFNTRIAPTSLYSNFNPNAITDSGAFVLGGMTITSSGASSSFVWSQSSGVTSFSDFMTANGVTVPLGFSITAAIDMTPDGKTFVGYGTLSNGTQAGFVVTIPATPSAAAFGYGLMITMRRRRAASHSHAER